MMVVTCVDISGLEICYDEGNAKCCFFYFILYDSLSVSCKNGEKKNIFKNNRSLFRNRVSGLTFAMR